MARISSALDIAQVSDPATPVAGRQFLYFKSDGASYTKRSDGSVAAFVTTDAAQTITGAKTFTSNVTVGSTFTLANPGVGVASVINFAKSSDSAGISVLEYASDSTRYAFTAGDNPDGTSDAFTWAWSDWQNPGSGWSPLYMTNIDTVFNSRLTTFNGNVTFSASPYITSNNGSFGARDWLRTTTPTKSVGTGTITCTIDATGYTGGGSSAMWVTLDSATTFAWGTGTSTNTATQTALAVGTTPVTLSNGVKVSFSAATGGVTGDTWTMRVYPGGTATFGGNATVSGTLSVGPGPALATLVLGDATVTKTSGTAIQINTGITATGVLQGQTLTTTSGATMQFGGGATIGVYVDATNIAIRTVGATTSNLIYFQGNAGAGTSMTYQPNGGILTGLSVLNATSQVQEGGVRVYSVNNKVPVTGMSATGTANSTTYLRGDNTWAVVTAAAPTNMSSRAFTMTVMGC